VDEITLAPLYRVWWCHHLGWRNDSDRGNYSPEYEKKL